MSKTYWNVEVTVDGQCKCSTGGETLADAIRRALSDAIYYQAIYPGAKVALCGLRESCAACGNAGTVTVRRPRSWKTGKCPECRGAGASGVCGDIPLEMPDSANGIRLAVG
jgi:hypothetical protein